MEQLPYLNKIHIYGNKDLLRGKIKIVKYVLFKIIDDHKLNLDTIEINLIGDEVLLNINIQSLNHNYYTDIITFDYSQNSTITGDIYISLDRIKDNSKLFKKSYLNELLRVLIHGTLHLSGYKDKKKDDKLKMTIMENRYLNLYNTFHGEQFKKN